MTNERAITENQFHKALLSIRKPGARFLRVIEAHACCTGRAMTASNMAAIAGYANWRGINMQYGRLAAQLRDALGRTGCGIELLVDGIAPNEQTNEHWLLIMKPEFKRALERAGWI